MVILEQCRIDSEGKHLIIDASVENLSYYEDVFISDIIIDTLDTFIETGPSNLAIFHSSWEDIATSQGYNKEEVAKGTKKLHLCLSKRDLGVSLNKNIFFVYIITSGSPSMNTPCGMDNIYTMGIALNLKPIYNQAMTYINELSDTCNTPKGFIDMILRLKAFDLSLRTGNYPIAIKYWNKLFKDNLVFSPPKRCGCNGIN